MSQTYIAILVMVGGALLPKLGLEIGNDDLTTAVSVIAVIIGAIWAMVRRYLMGGINAAGIRN